MELYSATPPSAAGERNDCFVRALAVSAKIPYAAAHKLATEVCGRKYRKGTVHHKVIAGLPEFKNHGINIEPVNATYARRDGAVHSLNLRGFCKANPKGNFLVLVNGHALAICDGEIKDWNGLIPRIGRKVRRAFLVTNQIQLELF